MVVFTPLRRKLVWWAPWRIVNPEFFHCLCIISEAGGPDVLVDWTDDGLDAIAMTESYEAAAHAWIDEVATAILVVDSRVMAPVFQVWRPFGLYCVATVLQALRARAPLVFTPRQLYRWMVKRHALVVRESR